MSRDIKWIIILVVVAIIAAATSGVTVNRFSKKEERVYQRKLDSLHLLFIQKEEALKHEVAIRRKIFLFDSIKIAEYKLLLVKDSILIKKQKNLLNKYKTLPASVNLSKLDSAYEAEN